MTKLDSLNDLVEELAKQEAHGPFPVVTKRVIASNFISLISTPKLYADFKLNGETVAWAPGNENMGWLKFDNDDGSIEVFCIDDLPIGYTERDFRFLSLIDFKKKFEAKIVEDASVMKTIKPPPRKNVK